MALTRLGNKARIAPLILSHFPEHTAYVELFFGAGGLFFNKPLAKYNFLNDADTEVVNLFDVVRTQKKALEEMLVQTPIHEALFERWKTEKESEPIARAVRFLIMSNQSVLGKMGTLRFACENPKKMILKHLGASQKMLENTQMMCCDFRDTLRKIAIRDSKNLKHFFIYADPPYLDTVQSTYQTGSKWTLKDTQDLFKTLIESQMRFAISEFDNPVILDLAKQHNLNVIPIKERQNLKNRRTEILITNYKTNGLF